MCVCVCVCVCDFFFFFFLANQKNSTNSAADSTGHTFLAKAEHSERLVGSDQNLQMSKFTAHGH